MTSPYQNAVVGAIQTIPLDLPDNARLHITEIPNWANYRYIIQVMTGPLVAGVKYIHESEAAGAQDMIGNYDTGWWQSRATGYVQGDSIPDASNSSGSWWTGRDLPIPPTKCGPVVDVPESIPLGYGCTGIRVISFVYFGSFDATTQNLIYKTSDATGLDLASLDGGYYQDLDTGKVWRSSWQEPYTSNPNVPGSANLKVIVERVAKRGGLDAEDYDADDLATVSVSGYPIARQSNAADCLLPLLQAYFAYGTEYDAKLHFHFYGADAAAVIDRADLIEGNDANDGAITSNLRNQTTEFPRRIVAAYMDPAQNYSAVNVAAERQATDVIAIGDQSFQIPVVMPADDAAKAANKALKVAYATLEGTLGYSTPFAGSDVYLALVAGSPLQFQGKRYVLDELILGNGNLKLTTRYDRQSAYTSNVQAITGNSPSTPSSPYSGPTTLVAMNLPSLRPQDTNGLYLAAASTIGSASWEGCTVQASFDAQTSWQNVLTIVEASVFGALSADEPVGGEPLTVLVNGDLESATETQLAANANAFALVSAATLASEIGQFATADETLTANEYELTDILRGQLGTTKIDGVLGDSFVMLESVYFLPVDISFSGNTLYFRAVGFGEVAESAPVISVVYSPDLTVIHDGGVVTT